MSIVVESPMAILWNEHPVHQQVDKKPADYLNLDNFSSATPAELVTWEDIRTAVPTRGRSRFNYFSPYGGMSLRRHSHIGIDREPWEGLRKVKGDAGRDERTMLGYFQRRFNKENEIDHRDGIDVAAVIAESLEEDPLPSPDVVKKSPFGSLLGLLIELRDRKVEESLPVSSENGNAPKTEHFGDVLPALPSDQLEGLEALKIRLENRELVKASLIGKAAERPLVRKVRSGRNGTSPEEEIGDTVTSGDDPMSWIAEDRARFGQKTRLEKMISGKVKDRGTGRRIARITHMVRQDRMRTTQGRTFEQKQAEIARKMAEGAKQATAQEANVA